MLSILSTKFVVQITVFIIIYNQINMLYLKYVCVYLICNKGRLEENSM